ncbi:alpha/beta fold hydrolase [Jannaschia sp. R86511]|uniref:alpha/beta fold hydrolase n=1 Tax=Jannaschia sp. R86511 TaxID=3093853 RepID=UPI0036D35929
MTRSTLLALLALVVPAALAVGSIAAPSTTAALASAGASSPAVARTSGTAAVPPPGGAALVATTGRGAGAVESQKASRDRGARVPSGFTEQSIQLEGVRLNYVRGGSGPTLVLLHGYPQTWYMWRDLLPELARHYTVIAPDLRGAGQSSAPPTGYDKATMAADVHQLLVRLRLETDVSLVGHDIGTMVAYAYAAAHPDQVRRLALTEAPIPDESLYAFPSLTPQGPGFWNFGFFSLQNGLPEDIIDGREHVWVEQFTDWLEVQDGVDSRDAREYARWLRDDAHLRASFEYFRALPQDVSDNEEFGRTALTMPVLALGAEGSLGQSVPDQVSRYASDVTAVVVADSGHWVFEEQPQRTTQILLAFLD